jgi:hypothetical protein
MVAKSSPVLMSPENPEGWTLEELTVQLIAEIYGKIVKIQDDERQEAKLVTANNHRIIGYLREIRELQGLSMEALANLGPNQGPLGKPRIGVGSDG